jgi:hypothetical protein
LRTGRAGTTIRHKRQAEPHRLVETPANQQFPSGSSSFSDDGHDEPSLRAITRRIRAGAPGEIDPKAHHSRHLTGRPPVAFLLVSRFVPGTDRPAAFHGQ